MHSTGDILREKGYRIKFFYGGNSYFDNMDTFFCGNGCEIVDQRQYTPEEINFSNIWGVCDEDAYDKAIRTFDEDAEKGVPFFAHILTVSNHRPFTYPAGKISIPTDSKSRAGGVTYSDYALGHFLKEAQQRPWFENTVFLITADHRASSAERTEIPLEKYHIPAVIYAPGLIDPGIVEGTVSQIDLLPTLFWLLGMDYDSHFYGKSVFDPTYTQRAFVATYQDMDYLEGDILTVLSPVSRYEQSRIVPTAEDAFYPEPMQETDAERLDQAIGFSRPPRCGTIGNKLNFGLPAPGVNPKQSGSSTMEEPLRFRIVSAYWTFTTSVSVLSSN